jgi:hypothetical protein
VELTRFGGCAASTGGVLGADSCDTGVPNTIGVAGIGVSGAAGRISADGGGSGVVCRGISLLVHLAGCGV